MTKTQFEKKHKSNVLQGFDGLDGKDVWKEFKEDLAELLKSERDRLAIVAGNAQERCKFGDVYGHCECSTWAKVAVSEDKS
jgi:hypothetical protein